jgi:hypothetical protein
MLRIILIVLLALPSVLALAAEVECPSTGQPPAFDEVSSEGCVGELGWFPQNYVSSSAGVQLGDLEKKLGRSKRTWSGPDHFKGEETFTFREFKTDNVIVLVSQPEGSDRIWIEEFQVVAAGLNLPCALAIGQPRDEVVRKLGASVHTRETDEGSEVGAGWSRFWCEEHRGRVIRFASHCGIRLLFDESQKLQKISWQYFPD